jgi:hypothetical protein
LQQISHAPILDVNRQRPAYVCHLIDLRGETMDRTRAFIAAFVPTVALLLLPASAGAQATPHAPVACISQGSLWSFLDARDVNDTDRMRQLLNGKCRLLENASYSLVASRNGTARILVFKRPGDWESAVTLYTLDEMLRPGRVGEMDVPGLLS